MESHLETYQEMVLFQEKYKTPKIWMELNQFHFDMELFVQKKIISFWQILLIYFCGRMEEKMEEWKKKGKNGRKNGRMEEK